MPVEWGGIHTRPAATPLPSKERPATVDIIEKLDDLVKQATTERSHYYVAATAKEAAEIIRALRADQQVMARIIESAPLHR